MWTRSGLQNALAQILPSGVVLEEAAPMFDTVEQAGELDDVPVLVDRRKLIVCDDTTHLDGSPPIARR
ncbi:MAG: hypothetical protein R3E48_23360 [Burkholderiaceae bacterium]